MLNIIRGDDTTINVTCTDSAGNPIDITGYAVFFTAKRGLSDSDASAVISKKVTSHTNPTAGITKIDLANNETDIDEGDYVYDFQLVDSQGKVSSANRDILSVAADVTLRTT